MLCLIYSILNSSYLCFDHKYVNLKYLFNQQLCIISLFSKQTNKQKILVQETEASSQLPSNFTMQMPGGKKSQFLYLCKKYNISGTLKKYIFVSYWIHDFLDISISKPFAPWNKEAIGQLRVQSRFSSIFTKTFESHFFIVCLKKTQRLLQCNSINISRDQSGSLCFWVLL